MFRANAALIVVTLLATGCWEQVSREWFAQMKEQPAVQALEGVAPLAPPADTVPAGGIAARVPESDPLFLAAPMHSAVARSLQNPIPKTPESIARGEEIYGTYCVVCHAADGLSGAASMPVGKRLTEAGAPPFPIASVVAYTDGQIFTKIRYGRPNMPGYPQISEEDRWHCVNYLRELFKGS